MIKKGSDTKQVCITHVETVTSLGYTLDELWQGLLAGHTAIKPVRRFPITNYKAGVAACIPDLMPRDEKSMIHSLLHRLLKNLGPVPPDTFPITATTKAGIDNLERIRRGGKADPNDILPFSIWDILSQRLGLKTPGIHINAACASSTLALARGAALIASGLKDVVLVCAIDLLTEFVFSGFSSLGALSRNPCMPFDRERDGLSLGEGAAALLLMNPSRAQKENRPCLAKIKGWGAANDAAHVTAPSRNGTGLILAISQAINRANLKPEDISAVCAHGTGTVYNDMMELTAFYQVFGKREIPIFSIKGAIGHTMGAAGGLEAAVGVKSLSARIVPPTIGFLNPEDGAEGRVSRDVRELSGDFLLSTNSGFGGINAVIILEKGDKP
jgi:3-oxoacyl-[acyl-carrier-protein] synthase II